MSGTPENQGSLEPPEEKESQTPAEVEVTIKGKTFKVTPEMAETLKEREADFDRKLNEQGQELGELRKKVEKPKEEASPGLEDEEYRQAHYTDPVKAKTILLNEVKKIVSGNLGGTVDKAVNGKLNVRDFWDTFYEENEVLKGHEDVVKMVIDANADKLRPMTMEAGKKELARLTKEKLVSIATRFTSSSSDNSDEYVESSSGSSRKKERPEALGDVVSASDILRKRRR